METPQALELFRYDADGNGNISLLVDGAGNVQAKYLYDSYGNIVDKRGLLADANTYRFSSKEVDGKSGLYYYGCRYYEPNLQRWLNSDPIQEEGGINLYGFVENSPVNHVDPFGLEAPDVAMAEAADPTIAMDENAMRVLRKKAADALENKLRHIFDKPRHNLDCILKQFEGDRKKAFDAINDALKNQKLPDNQLFETTVKVGEKVITVLGKTVNGVSKIGTAYIP